MMKQSSFALALAMAGTLTAGALATPLSALAVEPAGADVPDSEADLSAAWDAFAAQLASMKQFVRSHPTYRNPENRAVAYAYLSTLVLARIEEDIIFDPDFPYFREIGPRTREGGDNPDQRYLISTIRGGETYRIWGTRGQLRRLDFQVYAGDPFVPKGGRAASFLSSDDVVTNPDGTFELWVSPTKRAGNWIENPADGSQVIVRQIFSDWNRETPGDIHIDRVGHEGDLKPVVTEREMAARLRQATRDLDVHVKAWPALVARNYTSVPVNTLGAPRDPGAQGGVPGRFMVSGHFDLAPDEALVIRTWPMSGNYQGIQLADMWYSSLEYGNRQTSLTGDQSYKNADGSYSYVISARDPGVPNWLDTYERRQGVIMLRFDGMQGKPFDPAHYPYAEKVKLRDIRSKLPKDTPSITPQQRAQDIAQRRHHVQLRYHN